MSLIANWIQTPMARALGWALAHFLWEGAVLAAALLLTLRILRAAPARLRYAAACLVLAAMPLAFAATLAVLWSMHPAAVAAPIRWAPVPLGDGPIAVVPPRFSWAMLADRLPWLAPVWFAGVAFFYARGLASWSAVRRLRRRGVCAAPAEWQQQLDRLAARLRVSRPVALLESCLSDTPVLIGYLRPAILLPVGCLTGLSAAQVECILLHELAHVARRDYVVNLLQSLVEGLLFYHPAVWWVSRVVRAERENCCDDLAVEMMGDAHAYAATLVILEERRALAPAGALAASGGNLMARIRRLTARPCGRQTTMAPAASAAALLAIFAAALTALPAQLPVARRTPGNHAPMRQTPVKIAAAPQKAAANLLPTPYRKWLSEDVAYIIEDQERSAFLKLTSDAERENFIEQFWQKRDPTPGTQENEMRDEHYRRIAYTNEHFSASGIPGWKTDRGRMYIVYGPPDELDNHPAAESKPATQQWRYRYIEGVGTNVIVEFVDLRGAGDYRMTSDPSAEQGLPPQYRKWLHEDAAYIITVQERGAFLQLTSNQERDNFIKQFWERRGEPYRTEHYRRIAYANENFASGIPGWKTDRGRVYIMYGPPDTIASLNGHVIEWTYAHIEGVGNNVVVQFADRSGSGEYLMTKGPGEVGQDVPVMRLEQQEAQLQKRLAEIAAQLNVAEQSQVKSQIEREQLATIQAQLAESEARTQRAGDELPQQRLQELQATIDRLQAQMAKSGHQEKLEKEIEALSAIIQQLQNAQRK